MSIWFHDGTILRLISTHLPRPALERGLLPAAAFLVSLTYKGAPPLSCRGTYLTLAAAQKRAVRVRMDRRRHLDRRYANYYESTPPEAGMYPLKDAVEEIA